MTISETVTSTFIDAVNGLTPDLDDIFETAKSRSIGDWKTLQNSMVTASGAASAAIPGMHLVGLAADVAFVLNRMGVSTFGVGAILAEQANIGNILEKDDFPAVLGYWCGDDDIRNAMQGKSAAAMSKLGLKVGTKLVGKAVAAQGISSAMLGSAGYLVAQKFGGKVAAKSAAKFAAKFAAKGAGGFIPLLGPAISGGVNLWLISSIISAAEEFYADKINLVSGKYGY